MGMTVAQIQKLTEPGRYRVGDTLYLVIGPGGGGRSWIQRMMINGQRADIGLGSALFVTLAMARRRALENRQLVWNGGDPRAAKRRAKVPTFRKAAASYVEANAPHWRNARTAERWGRQLELHAYQAIGGKRVDQISRADVLRIVAPLIQSKPDTGRKVRQMVRAVLAAAQAHGHVDNNPAGDAIEAALPRAVSVKAHHKALPYGEVGEAFGAVEASSAGAAVKACFAFAVLTACRNGEARGATWSEIDTERREWRIPPERMKQGREHRVPLSDAALAVLAQAAALIDGSGLLFPSPRGTGRQLDESTLVKLLQGLGVEAVPHGFRSSFRTWAAECTNATRDVAETALSHSVGSAVERSYARSDLFDKRRELMAQWAAFVTGARS